MKSDVELLSEILNTQRAKILACEIDLVVYGRKNLIVKDARASSFFEKKIAELKAMKERAEETIGVIQEKMKDLTKKKLPN